jgi:glycosyltransferase involved in cell wall biosynthesis
MHWFPERQGGLDRVYWELVRALPSAGVAVTGLVAGSGLCAVDTGGAVRPFAPTRSALPARLFGARREFARQIGAAKPDLVVSHFALYTVPVLDMLRGIPLVVHFQGPWADEGAVEGNRSMRYLVKRWVENLVYRRAARAIVLSRAFGEVLATRYDVARERIRIIPGGIDAARFAVQDTPAAARLRLRWPADRKIVVAVRRLVPRMGLENLLTAIEAVKETVPNVLLVIAGRGVLQPVLTAQIAARGLGEHVRLTGFIPDDDLPFFYRAADISVVPTVALEGFGLVVAESLAAGTPCLVTPVGGLPEVVSELCEALVLESTAPAAIATALVAALSGRIDLPSEAACRDYAARKFDWSVIAAKVAAVYREAVG